MKKPILTPQEPNDGVGLWGVSKKVTTTPLQYLGVVVFGISMLALAVEMLWLRITRGPDILWSIPQAIGLIMLAVFVSHAGIIYWYRRLFRRNRQRAKK